MKFNFYIVSRDSDAPEISGTDDIRIARECAAEFVVINTETGRLVEYAPDDAGLDIPEQTLYKLSEHRK